MPRFSKLSEARLATCDPKLQRLMHNVILGLDIIILCGHRGEEDQNKAFREGKSKLKFPKSAHNSEPSSAVDVAPYHDEVPHIHWDDIQEFKDMITYIKRIAERLGIEVEFGGDWQGFKDYPHIQLKEEQEDAA